MGQEDVIDILKKMGRPMSRREIAELLECSAETVSHIISRLKKFNEICEVEIDRKEAYNYHKDCKVHRRMKLYFLE